MPAFDRVNAVKCFEHRDSLATAMSVDYTGQWVLLAGRRNLALQRLDGDGTLRKYCRNSKYEVSAAEFAICSNRSEFCAIATTDHIDIVTWGTAEPRNFHSLRGHTRTITDIDWHSKDPNLLVSCSIDTFSHIWDLRDPKKPTLSLNAVCMSGATQVGFNRVSGNLLAAAHDGDLRIWDIRKGSCPTHYITAHLNRVHGINWSHLRESFLCTASQDGTVKYFDVNNPRRAEKIITTESPVWRARYTPIGNGLVSIIVPHHTSRAENSLLLWSNSKTDPVTSFVGHTDVILDFAWRPNHPSQTEIELVTWSRDRSLRVWKIDENMLKLCEPDSAESSDMNEVADTPTNFQQTLPSSSTPSSLSPFHQPSKSLTIQGIDALQIGCTHSPPTGQIAASLSIRSNRNETQAPMARSLTDQSTCLLHHEFSLLNTNIPHVEVNIFNAIKRYAIFKILAGGHEAILEVHFPTEYPSPSIIPNFTFCQGSNIPDQLSGRLLKVLKTNALQRVKRSRTCLEQCLRALVKEMKESGGVSSFMRLPSPRLEGALSIYDACIPFPRTSSVKFNAIGMLATFGQVINSKILTLRHQNKTKPRSLSAAGGSLLCNVMGPQPVLYTHRDSNASFYRMNSKSQGKTRSLSNKSTIGGESSPPIVYIYEANKLLNLNRDMAQQYSLDKCDLVKTCRHNRQVAEKLGCVDVIPIWILGEMIATPKIPNELLSYNDPFNKLILEALIMHLAMSGDLQTSAVLSCLFHKFTPNTSDLDALNTSPSSANIHGKLTAQQISPYHTVLPIDYQASHSRTVSAAVGLHLRQLRSNSWSDSLDSKLFNFETHSLIRRSRMTLFDNFKRAYSEILFAWQLLTERALILKHTMYSKTMPQGIEFVAECTGCNKAKRVVSCSTCCRPVLYCALCCLPVKGAALSLSCGHGGHLEHILNWFKTHTNCPKCGFSCLQQTSSTLEQIF